MNTKRSLYAPALFTALALIAASECLALGAEARTEHAARKATVFRETQKIKDGPVMAEYQIAIANGEMALTTMIVNAKACAQWQSRERGVAQESDREEHRAKRAPVKPRAAGEALTANT